MTPKWDVDMAWRLFVNPLCGDVFRGRPRCSHTAKDKLWHVAMHDALTMDGRLEVLASGYPIRVTFIRFMDYRIMQLDSAWGCQA